MNKPMRAWDPWNPIDPKNGKPAKSEAARLRAQQEDRRRAVAALGWPAEPIPCPPGERYCASAEEMWQMLGVPLDTGPDQG